LHHLGGQLQLGRKHSAQEPRRKAVGCIVKQNGTSREFLHVFPLSGTHPAEASSSAGAPGAKITSLGQRILDFGEQLDIFAKQCAELTQQLASAADELRSP